MYNIPKLNTTRIESNGTIKGVISTCIGFAIAGLANLFAFPQVAVAQLPVSPPPLIQLANQQALQDQGIEICKKDGTTLFGRIFPQVEATNNFDTKYLVETGNYRSVFFSKIKPDLKKVKDWQTKNPSLILSQSFDRDTGMWQTKMEFDAQVKLVVPLIEKDIEEQIGIKNNQIIKLEGSEEEIKAKIEEIKATMQGFEITPMFVAGEIVAVYVHLEKKAVETTKV